METTVIDANTLARNWWVVLLRGIAGLVFGAFAFLSPAVSFAALVFLFGAYAFADGILSLVSAIRDRGTTTPWWMLVLEGLAGIGAGVTTMLWPGISALVLLFVIATWSAATGVLEIVAAIRLRKVIRGEWLLGLSGVASIAFAGLLVVYPGRGAIALVLWIGAYSIAFGALLIGLAFRLRSFARLRAPDEAAFRAGRDPRLAT